MDPSHAARTAVQVGNAAVGSGSLAEDNREEGTDIEDDQRDQQGLEVVHELRIALAAVLHCEHIVHFLPVGHQRQAP